MAATIQDVAKLAGCSITTVSRAFSAPNKVRPDTRDRIERAAAALQYSPNAIARAMVMQKSNSIAFVIGEQHYPIMHNPFYADIAEAVQIEAERMGYNVYITSTGAATRTADLFMRKRMDGVVLAGQTDQKLLTRLHTQGMPLVLVNNRIDLTDVASITSNDYSGATLAVEHLIAKGHTRIGLVAGNLFHYISQSRYQAYCDTLRRHGLLVEERYIVSTEATQQDALRAVDGLMAQPVPPSALFCMNDRIAVGAVKAALRRGLRVPDEVAVVGFDDSNICTVIEPELTTVAVDTGAMGTISAKTLIRLIEGRQPKQMQVVLTPKLVVRGSA